MGSRTRSMVGLRMRCKMGRRLGIPLYVFVHLCDVETSLNVPHTGATRIYTIQKHPGRRIAACVSKSISNENVYTPSFIAARRASMASSSLLASSPASSALIQPSAVVSPSLAPVLGSVVHPPISSSSNSRRRRAHSASLSSDSAAVGKDVWINASGVAA